MPAHYYKPTVDIIFDDCDSALLLKEEIEQIIKEKLIWFPSFTCKWLQVGYTNDDFMRNITRIRITFEQQNTN
jgi:hypothetical protein